jgi:hypothetical protein
MIKKLLLLSVVLSQFAISCSSDESEDPTTDPVTEEPVKPTPEQTLAEQIAALLKQPYSALTPAQQKTKLEAEANDMLVQLDKSKSSGAIEAIENLNRLLDISEVDLFNGKNDNKVEDVLNVSGVYGIYTWNSAGKSWTKTASTTDLKFVFPAKSSQTTNNAVLSAKSVSSNVKIKYYDGYLSNTNGGTQVYDNVFLPASTDATLTIDDKQSATFTQTAKYSAKNQSPDEFAYKMTLNDGYTWEMNGKKGAENTSKASLTYNGKNLIDFNIGSTANIDGLIDNDELVQYRGKANGLIKLMENFVIIADMDLATAAADEAALNKSLIRPKYLDGSDPKSDYKAYYTALNEYEKKQSEGAAANFNKNFKLILVSKKDGTKLADLVRHSEKSGNDYVFNLPVWESTYDYWYTPNSGETFAQPYLEEVLYLKFNDNTEVAFSVYFSAGFEKFEAKLEEFAKAFEK